MSDIAFPYHFDGRGRTADTGYDRHIRDLIEQLVFTNPGERVNRPELGSGLLQLVFAPASEELAAATQVTVQAALMQWLGERIEVEAVEVTAEGSTLRVTVAYRVIRNGERRVAQLVREVPA